MLRIEEWHNRYHPGLFADETLPRFEKARALAVDEALEQALRGLNLNERELICIREIRVSVYLRLSAPLQNQAFDWSRAIVEQIRRLIKLGDAQVLRYYPSRGDAWISCARAIVKGNMRDYWAWRQIAMVDIDATTSPESAVTALFEGLADEPAYLLPVIGALNAERLFELLLLRTHDSHWRLIRSILNNHFNASFEDIFPRRADGDGLFEFRDPLPPAIRQAGDAGRLQTAGTLHAERLERSSRQTIALVILALGDPGVLFRPPEIVRQQLTALFLTQYRPVSASHHDISAAETAAGRGSNEAALLEFRHSAQAGAKSPAMEQGENFTRGDGYAKGLSNVRVAGTGKNANDTAQGVDGFDFPTFTNQTVSEFGGLLYLLNLVERPCKLADRLARETCFRQRTMSWVWLHLAHTLIPADLEDPAVMAFAGQIPGLSLDGELQMAPNDEERLQLDLAASDLLAAAQDRLGNADSDLADHMDEMFRRRAMIRADPGWFEIEFSLNDVDTGIRLAGLDIDPGFLPWLAVVMRFRYA